MSLGNPRALFRLVCVGGGVVFFLFFVWLFGLVSFVRVTVDSTGDGSSNRNKNSVEYERNISRSYK